MPTAMQIKQEIKHRIAALEYVQRTCAATVLRTVDAAVDACFLASTSWEPVYDRKRAERRQRAWLVRNKITGAFHLAKNGRPQVYEFEHSAISVARRLNENSN